MASRQPMEQPAETADARTRILQAALEVFASKGYAQASTREICQRAGANVAGIHYYFGDKASLYKELMQIPEHMVRPPEILDETDTSLEAGLQAWYSHVMTFVLETYGGSHMRLLFLREQVDPSGLLDVDRVGIIGLYHEQLVRFLKRHLGIEETDSALNQLAITLVGMAMMFYVERAAIRQLTPGLMESEADLEAVVERMVCHAIAAVEAERKQRE
ncbi:MAG TPA: hypothetical protein DCM54_03595 [Gammaproteobacteria bacterium]|nr:hypothetical protein [Gammaproteobacteria bacterium]